MLPKKNRVPRHLFPLILIKGKNYSSSNMYMRVARLPDRRGFPYKKDQKEIRFSFVVSKKAAKLAVVRNKLCHIGYDTIQKNISDIEKNCLAAIFIKKGAADLSKKELEKEIIFLLKKANLLKTCS